MVPERSILDPNNVKSVTSADVPSLYFAVTFTKSLSTYFPINTLPPVYVTVTDLTVLGITFTLKDAFTPLNVTVTFTEPVSFKTAGTRL